MEVTSKLLECVPNISEGRNPSLIRSLTDQLRSIKNLQVLHVDIGYDANRTVYTWIGTEKGIREGLYALYEFALLHIDMSTHEGAHPCIGAVDVIPLVPFQHVTKLEAHKIALRLAKGIAQKFAVPIFLYGELSHRHQQKTLADIRRGGYTTASIKLAKGALVSDFGPNHLHKRIGATCLTARSFMIAYNINLNTTDLSRAKAFAAHLRSLRASKPLFKSATSRHSLIRFEQLADVKFLAWYMDLYRCCQLSTNIYDIDAISLSDLYLFTLAEADKFQLQLTGSELIGMCPLSAIHPSATLDNYQSLLAPLGITTIPPFVPEERIFELALRSST